MDCGDPGTPSNGSRNGSVFTFGGTVRYECSEGYRLSGSIIRKCQATAKWSGDQAVCKGKIIKKISFISFPGFTCALPHNPDIWLLCFHYRGWRFSLYIGQHGAGEVEPFVLIYIYAVPYYQSCGLHFSMSSNSGTVDILVHPVIMVQLCITPKEGVCAWRPLRCDDAWWPL